MKLTCKEASLLVSQEMDRPLGIAERLRLRLHLAVCDGCANFTRSMRLLRRAVRSLRERSEPGPRS